MDQLTQIVAQRSTEQEVDLSLLGLSSAALEAVWPQIDALAQRLTSLGLDNNRLCHVPQSLCQLGELRWLHLNE